tara:strand:+ start:1928 stop:2092 length:165 start_codon:yes stop_codon:yes gene_type:complete
MRRTRKVVEGGWYYDETQYFCKHVRTGMRRSMKKLVAKRARREYRLQIQNVSDY